MISDDIRQLVEEALGDKPEVPADDVVEKIASSDASLSEELLAEVDEALGSGDSEDSVRTHVNDGKVAVAMLLVAGDILAQGRG